MKKLSNQPNSFILTIKNVGKLNFPGIQVQELVEKTLMLNISNMPKSALDHTTIQPIWLKVWLPKLGPYPSLQKAHYTWCLEAEILHFHYISILKHGCYVQILSLQKLAVSNITLDISSEIDVSLNTTNTSVFQFKYEISIKLLTKILISKR